MQDTHNDTTKLIHYDSCVYTHSPHKDNTKGEAELRGMNPQRFKSEKYYNNQEIYLEVLKRINTNSSPEEVIKQLNAFVKEYRLREGDELWMAIDRDKQSWSDGQIASIARQCLQKSFGLALSNPCFEVWLLLHRKDYNDYPEEKRSELFKNIKHGSRTRLEIELLSLCGSYNKSNLKVSDYLPHVKEAIQRAESLVTNHRERWPINFGSHIYKIVKKLLP